MPANPITDPFPGEDLLGIEPQLSQQVDPGWRHRLSLFVGRALSDTALDSEQLYRAGLLATLGQAVSPGVVKGLVVSFDITGTVTATAAAVAAGSNVSISVGASAGFQAGQQAVLDTGANQEQFTVIAIPDATHIVAATLVKAHAADVNVQFEPLMNPTAGTGARTTTTAAVVLTPVPLTVANSSGFQTGQPATIDTGINQEKFHVTAIPDATHIVADNLIRRHASGVAIVQTRSGTSTTAPVAPGALISIAVADSSGFSPSLQAVIDTGNNQEQFGVASVPDATHVVAILLTRSHNSGAVLQPAAVTNTTAAVALNPVSITVGDSTGFQVGQPAVIDTNLDLEHQNQDQFNVVAIPDATHILADALANDHAAGVPVEFEPTISVAAGYGIAASGEDVYLLRDIHTKLSGVAVVDPLTGNTLQESFADYIKLPGSNSFAGVLLLQPVLVQATGTTLDTGTSPLIVSGNLGASCDQDPDENVFADLQVVDATRLVFVPWPATLTLPAEAPSGTWRNRLAYTIFNAELFLQEDDQLPWAMLGVPVAIAGFDDLWKPLFVDCGAVARAGGLPRRNYVLPVGVDEAPSLVEPALLQARISQFAEQLSERLASATPLGNLSNLFSTAPPSGIVPAAALDFVARKNLWFPPNWSLTVGPVHLEELETALQTGIMAAPLPVSATAPTDPTQLEPVEVLVPLPDELYDPNILITETVSGDFQAEIDLATGARNLTLKKRKAIQLETNALMTALGPNAPVPDPNLISLNADLNADEIVGRDAPMPYFPRSSSDPTKDETFGASTPMTWQPDVGYIVGQFVVDSNRNVQTVLTPGTSGQPQPLWNAAFSGITTDTVITTQVTAAVAAGASIAIPVVNTGGFGVGQVVVIDAGANAEQFTITAVSGQTQITADKLAKAHAVNVSVVFNSPLTWINNGPLTLGSTTWQPKSAYLAARHGESIPGLFIIDPNGNIQAVQTSGISSEVEPPLWGANPGNITSDGTVSWVCKGLGTWRPNTVYLVGQFIVDSKGNIQTVTKAGTSTTGATSTSSPSTGTSAGTQPLWDLGKETVDGSLTWVGNRPQTWQDSTGYRVGQWIVDSNGNIQIVTRAGASASSSPTWNTGFGQQTTEAGDRGAQWTNNGVGVWQPNTNFVAGQFLFDRNGNLQTIQTAGKSGPLEPLWNTFGFTSDGTVVWQASPWSSVDLQSVITYPGAFTADADGLTMLKRDPSGKADDMKDLLSNGLQRFIDHINARISQADDLINLGFLTAQTDIYRYRQNVLGTVDASKLATSPILANIATGDTSAVVSENLQSFLNTIPAAKTPFVPPGTPSPTPSPAGGTSTSGTPSASVNTRIQGKQFLGMQNKATLPSQAMLSASESRQTFTQGRGASIFGTGVSSGAGVQKLNGGTTLVSKLGGVSRAPTQYTPIDRGTGGTASTSGDVTQQQPLVGAQINIRTLTIAERLAQSRSQEALFYSLSNRLAFLQILTDLNITIDDLTILVDLPPGPPSSSTSPNPNPHPIDVSHTVAELRGEKTKSALLASVQNVQIPADADESTVFSTGIRVLEQHSQLLRALEGRVQQYRDFVSFCTTALNNIQADVQQAQTALKQMQNNLLQNRQDLAFTAQLLADEQARVAAVNAKRTQTLQLVQVIAYTRARTLEATTDAPTRQLVPGNVTSPVPACLQQSVAIPPELREIVALLREAPVNWLPSVEALLVRLERPSLLYDLAASTQVRATVQLQLPQPRSSADTETGVYAPVISNLYYANQQVFQTYTAQRSSFQVTQLVNQSWNSMIGVLKNVAAVGDLISSATVHAEIVNATARLITQISNVATCLYTRVSNTDPEFRLAWAEFLRGPGLSLQLQSLSILPNWTQQEYVARDQMQMLVDWLFQQIDTSNSAAVAFMSDVVRVCILLASHAPVDEIITSALTTRTKPIVGGPLTLNLPSARVASGMYVNLYSNGVLAAQAVVSDLNRQSVKATVTNVYKPDVYIETTDVAHFTAQVPNAVALRAFAS